MKAPSLRENQKRVQRPRSDSLRAADMASGLPSPEGGLSERRKGSSSAVMGPNGRANVWFGRVSRKNPEPGSSSRCVRWCDRWTHRSWAEGAAGPLVESQSQNPRPLGRLPRRSAFRRQKSIDAPREIAAPEPLARWPRRLLQRARHPRNGRAPAIMSYPGEAVAATTRQPKVTARDAPSATRPRVVQMGPAALRHRPPSGRGRDSRLTHRDAPTCARLGNANTP